MEINENEFKYLVPTNKDNSLWDFTLFAEFTFETSNFQDYTKEREKLEKELEKLQERIDQEIALTEKITNSIKAKSSDTAKDLNALKDIEIQWRTAQVNIDNIKKMMVPKVNRIKELEEKIIDEKVYSIENIRNEFINKLNDTISSTEEQLNLLKDKIESLYSIHKALIEIEKEKPKFESIDKIIPNPVDAFDVFFYAINEYIEKLKNYVK